MSLLRAVLSAIGEGDSEIGGLLCTRLTLSAEPLTALYPPFTWAGTATVLTPDTAGVSLGDWIQLGASGTAYEIVGITTDTDVTLALPVGSIPPTGPLAHALTGTVTWDGTTTVVLSSPAQVAIGLWLRKDADGQWFRIIGIVGGSITIENPGSLAIPTGAGASSWSSAPTTYLRTTVLCAESVVGWPDSGQIAVDGQLYTYTTKDDLYLEFRGLTYREGGEVRAGVRVAHSSGATIYDASAARSAIDQLRRATLVDYAQAQDLNALGRNLGVMRYPFLSDDDQFRAIIKALAYCPRGTMQAFDLFLGAALGAGNFEVVEDLISHPCTVFVRLLGAVATSALPEGKAYLTGRELRRSTTTSSIPYGGGLVSRGHVHSVRLADEDHLSDFRLQKPSADVIIEYLGDPGTTVWTWTGADEGTNVTVLPDSEGVEIANPTFGAVSQYSHTLRITADALCRVSCVCQANSAGSWRGGTGRGRQWATLVEDGYRQVGWGFVYQDSAHWQVGLWSGAFVGGLTSLLFDRYYDLELRIVGRAHVELWADGQLLDRQPYSVFTSATAVRALSFGVLESSSTHHPKGRVRQTSYYVQSPQEYSADRDVVGSTNVANPTQLSSAGAGWQAGDVGHRLRLTGAVLVNPSGGNGNGVYAVATRLSTTLFDLRGEQQAGALIQPLTPTSTARITVPGGGRVLRYPDDLGKTLVITGSAHGNDGNYTITTLRDPYSGLSLADGATPLPADTTVCEVVGTAFTAEADVDWRVDPSFITETGLTWELSDAQTVGPTTISLRQPLPATHTVVQVSYSQVLSAQVLLDFLVKNYAHNTIPPLIWAYYPFYLSDPLGYLARYLDEVKAAGITVEYGVEA